MLMSTRYHINKVLFTLIVLLSLTATPRVSAQLDTSVHRAPDFGAGDVWLDEGARVPHHITGYHGQVVLIDFWEYTCINCIRDFAILKRWYTKYHAYGFDVIGVHYGEFAIGFNVENVRASAQRFHLPWPVVADQSGDAWKAYKADGWPDRYLIDPQGDIVMKVLGERNNRELESKLRDLLAVAHPEVMNIQLEADADDFKPECGSPTDELFVGERYGRGAVEDMAGHNLGDVADFLPPHSPSDGGVMLVGRWHIEHDGVISDGHSAAAEVRYHARSLYTVLSLVNAKPIRVNLFEDGKPLPKDHAGSDVQFDVKGSYVEVAEARMYYLIRLPAFSAHLLSLQPEGSGLMLHSFTFGNNCQLVDQP